MEPTPDTISYMYAGYIVFSVVMIAYVVSLYTRWNSLKHEEEALKDIENKQ